MKQKQSEPNIIVPTPRASKTTPELQQQVERLQQHSIVELEAVRQFHQWLDTNGYVGKHVE